MATLDYDIFKELDKIWYDQQGKEPAVKKVKRRPKVYAAGHKFYKNGKRRAK